MKESVPLKSAVGVKVNVPSVLRVRVPFVGPSTSATVNESPSTSTSLESTLADRLLSSSNVNESSTAAGASFTAVTVIETVATVPVVVPSSAV